jgi:hypothetical protein
MSCSLAAILFAEKDGSFSSIQEAFVTPKDSASVARNSFVISSVRFDCHEMMRQCAPVRNTCAAGHEFPSWVFIAAYADFKCINDTSGMLRATPFSNALQRLSKYVRDPRTFAAAFGERNFFRLRASPAEEFRNSPRPNNEVDQIAQSSK